MKNRNTWKISFLIVFLILYLPLYLLFSNLRKQGWGEGKLSEAYNTAWNSGPQHQPLYSPALAGLCPCIVWPEARCFWLPHFSAEVPLQKHFPPWCCRASKGIGKTLRLAAVRVETSAFHGVSYIPLYLTPNNYIEVNGTKCCYKYY